MNAARGIVMAAGIVILLVGAYLLYFEADLNRWVSVGILTAGILVFIGVSVMMFAGGSRSDHAAAPGATVVQENRQPVRRHEPR